MCGLNSPLFSYFYNKLLSSSLFLFVLLISIFMTILAFSGCSAGKIETEQKHQSAIDFTIQFYETHDSIPTIGPGKVVSLAQIIQETNRPIILNFWAGLCPPCRAEMPDFQSLWENHSEEYLIIGIDIGPFVLLGTREEGMDLVSEIGITYPVGTTYDSGIVRDYVISGMPTTFIIDSDGLLIKRYAGMLTKEKALELLNEATNQ